MKSISAILSAGLMFYSACGLSSISAVKIEKIEEINISTAIPVSSLNQLLIAPDGSGQYISFQSVTEDSVTVTSEILSYPVSKDNVIGSPQLLANMGNVVPSIFSFHRAAAANGNYIFYITDIGTDVSGVTTYNGWTLYYDIVDGWSELVTFDPADKPLDMAFYIDANGVAYATQANGSKSFELYRYNKDTSSWSLLLSNVNANSLVVGANNKLYRVHEGDTLETGDDIYLSFLNATADGWEDPILLSMDNNGNSFTNVKPLVASNGDIFAYNNQWTYLPSTTLALNMRKYDSLTQTWSQVGEEVVYDIPNLERSPVMLNPFFIKNTSGEVDILLPVLRKNDQDAQVWSTIRYNETTGWQDQSVLFDKSTETESTLGSNLSSLGSQFFFDNQSHAFVVMCRDSCSEIFAKIYDTENGWSDELALPALGTDKGNGCRLDNAIALGNNPLTALNQTGDIIIASGLSRSRSGTLIRDKFIASATGDILTAESNANCPSTADATDSSSSSGGGSSSGSTSTGGSSSGSAISVLFLLGLLLPKFIGRFVGRYK